MKKSYLTCGGMFIIFIVIAIIGAFFGVRALNEAFRASLLQELGFSSENEYNDFVQVMNTPFDETTFYQGIYTDADIEYVKSELTTNITLKDGSNLFYDNGYLNIEALDIDDNITILNSMEFTPNQYAYFESLLFQSLFADSSTQANELSDISVLHFDLTSPTNHSIVLCFNTTELKDSLGDFAEALPNRLYITLKYDIINTTNSEYGTTNQSIQFNSLDETYNNKCIEFFSGIFQSHPAKLFADLTITLVNSFDKSTHTKTIYNENNTITIGGIQ